MVEIIPINNQKKNELCSYKFELNTYNLQKGVLSSILGSKIFSQRNFAFISGQSRHTLCSMTELPSPFPTYHRHFQKYNPRSGCRCGNRASDTCHRLEEKAILRRISFPFLLLEVLVLRSRSCLQA